MLSATLFSVYRVLDNTKRYIIFLFYFVPEDAKRYIIFSSTESRIMQSATLFSLLPSPG